MTLIRLLAAASLALSVAGCAMTDTATRAEVLEAPGLVAGTAQIQRSYDVQAINVVVPEDLRVSEANQYYPIADIVWRGDPIGNRYEQVAAIIQNSLEAGTAGLDGDTPVTVTVELVRWHGMTEKARFSVGGTYAMKFIITVADAATGQIIEGPRLFDAVLDAPGGQAAIALDMSGLTEKVRVTEYLTGVFHQQLSGAI